MNRSTFKKWFMVILAVIVLVSVFLLVFASIVKVDADDVIAYGIYPIVNYASGEAERPEGKLIDGKDEVQKMSTVINDFQKIRLYSFEKFSTYWYEGYEGERFAYVRIVIYVKNDLSELTVYESGGIGYKGHSFIYGSKANGVNLYKYIMEEYNK